MTIRRSVVRPEKHLDARAGAVDTAPPWMSRFSSSSPRSRSSWPWPVPCWEIRYFDREGAEGATGRSFPTRVRFALDDPLLAVRGLARGA